MEALRVFADETIPRFVRELSAWSGGPGFIALSYALVFIGGVVTSLGPCNLSMIPVLIGYVGGQQEISRRRAFRLSLFFTLGSSLTFTLLGVMAALVGTLFGAQKTALYVVVAAVCFAIGLNLLGALQLNFAFLTRLQPTRVLATGLPGAFLLGLVIGLVGSQCAVPILIAILDFVMAKGRIASGAGLLFVYGLGRGVPVVLAGTFTGLVRALPAMERWTALAERAAGCLLIAVGLYFLWMA